MPASQAQEEIVNAMQCTPQESAQTCTEQQIMDVSVLQLQEETVGDDHGVSARVRAEHTFEPTNVEPVPPILEGSVELLRLTPREQVQQSNEQMLTDLVAQIIPQERISGRMMIAL